MKKNVVLLFLCTVFAFGCAGAKWLRTPVASQHEFNVVLEQPAPQEGVEGRHYHHPYRIDEADLAQVMQDLQYLETGGLTSSEKTNPVFQEDEIDRLAPVLAEGLAKAGPGQRIRFTSFNQQKMLLFSSPGKTAGVMFVEPAGQLNIAFDFINAKRQASETSAQKPVYSGGDPEKIKTSGTVLSVSAPYAHLRSLDTGNSAPMWVVADLGKLHETVGRAPASTTEAADDATPGRASQVGDQAAAVDGPVPDQAPGQELRETVKTKLRYLRELLDEGLISEEDYRSKKQQLLDQI